MKKIVGLLAAVLLAPLLSSASAFAAPGSCATAWGSDLKTNYTVTSGGVVQGAGGAGEALQVRTGTDACWDRVVIDLAGPPGGANYNVAYVDDVTREGSGDVVAVPGAAKLQVSMLNPVTPGFDGPGSVTGYPTLRSVVYASDSEGLALGIGVRAHLPFRVFTLTGPNRVIVDIAHRWT